MVVLRHVAALREHEIARVSGATRGRVSRTSQAAHEHLGDLLEERSGWCYQTEGWFDQKERSESSGMVRSERRRASAHRLR